MKKTILNFLTVFFVVASVQVLRAEGNMTFNFDREATELKWSGSKSLGKKLLGEHHGKISLLEGTFIVDQEQSLQGGNFVIDMNSLVVLDGSAPEQEKLKKHLLDSDFFEADKFKTARLVLKKVKKIPAATKEVKRGTHVVTADLTIKGETHEIIFPATLKVDQAKVVASAKIPVDRLQFGITFMSKGLLGKAVSAAKNKVIDRFFHLDVKIIAHKAMDKIAR